MPLFATRFASSPQRSRSLGQRCRAQLRVEQLETRVLLTTFTPLQIRQAYGLNQLATGQVGNNDGSGETIALIDAFNDAHIQTDLDAFDQKYGVNPANPSQTLYQEYGASSTFLTVHEMASTEKTNSNWAMETALDVEWAHAIAPGAQILLVEAANGGRGSLLAAVDYASSQPGVVAVSMSWGYYEFATETHFDGHFPASNGITYIAASGDKGSKPLWPAVSPNVLAVGGTSLTVDASGNYLSETGWSNLYGGSGGGISVYEAKPSYQVDVPQSSLQRTSPDVAYDANPTSGFFIYDSGYLGGLLGNWLPVGGTSAGAPQWAGLIAIADQERLAAGGTPLSSSDTLNGLYSLLSSSDTINSTYLHDVSSGGPSQTPAEPGYDLATGLGTPVANQLIPFLANPLLVPSAAVVKGAAVSRSAAPAKDSPAVNARLALAVGTIPMAGSLPSSSTLVVAVLAPQTPQGQATAPIGLFLPLAPAPSAALVTASSGIGSGSLAAPVILPAPPPQPSNANVQSGAGNNAALPGDPDTDDRSDLDSLPDAAQENPEGATAARRNVPREAQQLPAVCYRAHTASFTEGDWLPAPLGVRAAGPEASSAEEPGSPLQPAAALAAMAVALGGYWGPRTGEYDRRKRQTLRG